MGMTIQFFAADAQELVSLFAAEFVPVHENEDTFDAFLDQLSKYPVADFSFHLLIPEDLDSLCHALRQHNPLVPPTFNDVLVKQLWKDQDQSLTLVAGSFVAGVAEMSNDAIEKAALDWAATFPYQEPLKQTPAYQALLRLREVVEEAILQKKALIFRLWGEPAFFKWE
jgi:hypothetical protein